MITSTPPATQPAQLYGGGPRVSDWGGRPAPLTPNQPGRPSLIAAAATAFVIAAAAVTTNAVVLAHPAAAAQHTITVVSPPPPTYTAAEIQAAQETACTAWDKAARALADASRLVASVAESTGGSSKLTQDARNDEKRVVMSQIRYVRTKLGQPTPRDVQELFTAWISAEIDTMHGGNMRDWDGANAARNRVKDLIDPIVAACGLRRR